MTKMKRESVKKLTRVLLFICVIEQSVTIQVLKNLAVLRNHGSKKDILVKQVQFTEMVQDYQENFDELLLVSETVNSGISTISI